MRPQFVSAVALFTVLLAPLLAQTTAGPMRPGRWEITMQMQVPNMPTQLPPMKNTQCITAEQLKDPLKALPSGPSGPDALSCKATEYKVSGNTVSWAITCGPPQNMSATGEMTFEGDTYAGTMKMTTQQGEITSNVAGKRLGDCTQ